MLQKVIDDYKNKKINDLEYLNRVKDIQEKVTLKKRNDVPEILQGNDEASAYYGAIKKVLTEKKMDLDLVEKYSSETGLFVFRVFQENYKVDFWKDEMAVNHVIDKIDDFLHDEIKSGGNIDLSMEDMDRIIDNTLQIARIRYETQVFK
jgi:type I restriction enzyme R subunit